MFLVSNYIKTYTGEQVLIPSLYDGPFKPNPAYTLEIDDVLLPPNYKKIPKVGRTRRKRHASRGEVGGPAKNRTVAAPLAADGLWGLSGVTMNEEPACGFDTNHEPSEEAAELELTLNPSETGSDATVSMEEEEIVVSADTDEIDPDLALLMEDEDEPTKKPKKDTRNPGSEGDVDEDESEEQTAASQGIIAALASGKAFVRACLICGKLGHNVNNCPLKAENFQPDGNDGNSSSEKEDTPKAPRRSG
jgi:hypothetical protein